MDFRNGVDGMPPAQTITASLGSETGRDPRRAGADDHHVQHPAACARAPGDSRHRLPALFDRVANEPHAARFPGNVDARHVGLEIQAERGGDFRRWPRMGGFFGL
ncbi:hypothetical protein ACFQBU_18225 [Jhaorihella thermophila]